MKGPLLLLLFLFTELCRSAPPAPAVKGLDGARLAQIAPRMKNYVDKGTIAGVVTLLARHGQIAHFEATGYQDLESKKPMRTDTLFEIMSMTKPVVGVAIMILAEEGKLALTDPVEKHLPEFRNQWMIAERDGDRSRTLKRPQRPITIRDLMTHTSGMPGGMGAVDAWKRSLAESVAIASQQPLEFEPGTRWLYSNTGINTLGRIIEVVSDKPFETFVAERIFQPLGMKDSSFFLPADKKDRIATVYTLREGKLVRADLNHRQGQKNPLPAGGMYSTAADMAAFYQMMLNGGVYNGKRILSKAAVEVMTRNHTGDIPAGHGPGLSFGLTWNVVKDPMGTLAMASIGAYSHGGAFGTFGWVDPAKDLIGVFMIQRAGGGGSDERNAFVAMANGAVLD